MSSSELFKEFKTLNKEEWLNKVVTDLNGAPLEKLQWNFEGFEVSPFYHSEDLPDNKVAINLSAQDNSWQIGEHFFSYDPILTNEALLEGLELGISSVFVNLQNANEGHIAQVFSGIQHEWISTHLGLSNLDDPLQAIRSFCKVIKEKGQKPAQVHGSIRLRMGDNFYWPILKEVFNSLPMFRVLLNPQSFGEQNSTTEITTVLNNTYDFFQKGQEQGVELSVLFEKMQYLVHVGDDYYKNIVLLRSIRLLVTQLCDSYNVNFSGSVCIETWLKKSDQSDDANYNLIKNTSQIICAVIGGSDYVYSTCYNRALKNVNANNRINRNISHVLKLESYMDRVIDPAAGSYFFESMTDHLCTRAWHQFQNREEL